MPDMEFFQQRPAVVPTIYAYTLPGVASHEGYIKVGYTEREDVNQRISEQLHTRRPAARAPLYGVCHAF